MNSSSLSLNVIPLNLPEESKRFSFYKQRPETFETVPLNPREMPANLRDIYKEPLYTDFATHDNADMTVAVQFKQSPAFANTT